MRSAQSIVTDIMNKFYDVKETKSAVLVKDDRFREDATRSGTHRTISDRPLTTYKDVVYNIEEYMKIYEENKEQSERRGFKRWIWQKLEKNELVHYGLTKDQLSLTEKKLYTQRRFLEISVLYDKITGNTIPLKDLIISVNHSPHRYYGEIQNRVNTLIDEATNEELVPLFMTITLPSEYHPFKLINKKLVKNQKFNGTRPREAAKMLTKRFAMLRNDRALREIPKNQRIYFGVVEPYQSGTPHKHILFYVPKWSTSRVIEAFKRLFPQKGNDIQYDLRNAGAYVMKYVNKTLPNSQGKSRTKKAKYLNAWYAHNRITRFSSSRTLAPLYLYRLLYNQYTLKALTRMRKEKRLRVYATVDKPDVILEIFDGDELVYMKNENYTLEKHRGGGL